MMYFVCALYYEAAPVIEHLDMKKDTSSLSFQLFHSQEAHLIISGTGSISCAVAATCLFTLYPPSQYDLAINLGVCGIGSNSFQSGSVFLCNKILDAATNKTYYPDLLYQHCFHEAEICTLPHIFKKNEGLSFAYTSTDNLFDMEASGFYQACKKFVQCNQIFIFKIVSDQGDVSDVTPVQIGQIMSGCITDILSWLIKINHIDSHQPLEFSDRENFLINCIIFRLQLSFTMGQQFYQLLHYYQLEHNSLVNLLEMINQESMQIHSKKEGKIYFEHFRERFIH